ncbi:MAG: hypothetical protein V1928_02145 [Parcubacteria group bacterium]
MGAYGVWALDIKNQERKKEAQKIADRKKKPIYYNDIWFGKKIMYPSDWNNYEVFNFQNDLRSGKEPPPEEIVITKISPPSLREKIDSFRLDYQPCYRPVVRPALSMIWIAVKHFVEKIFK